MKNHPSVRLPILLSKPAVIPQRLHQTTHTNVGYPETFPGLITTIPIPLAIYHHILVDFFINRIIHSQQERLDIKSYLRFSLNFSRKL